jgi:hypothetical protein
LLRVKAVLVAEANREVQLQDVKAAFHQTGRRDVLKRQDALKVHPMHPEKEGLEGVNILLLIFL